MNTETSNSNLEENKPYHNRSEEGDRMSMSLDKKHLPIEIERTNQHYNYSEEEVSPKKVRICKKQPTHQLIVSLLMETSDHPEESEETSSALSKTNQQSSWSIYQDHLVNLLQTKENLTFEEAYSLSKSNNFWPKLGYNFENLLEMFLKKDNTEDYASFGKKLWHIVNSQRE